MRSQCRTDGARRGCGSAYAQAIEDSPVDALGVVLAGGASTRLGRPKARARLAGRPLIERPLAALSAVVAEVVVVAKRDTPLPRLAVEVWHEPAAPRHPLTGVATALQRGGGRPVLVCALDLPFVGADDLRALLRAPASVDVVIAADPGGRWQPLVGRYGPGVDAALAEAAQAGRPVRSAVARMEPYVVALTDPWALHNVNTTADLRDAEAHVRDVAGRER